MKTERILIFSNEKKQVEFQVALEDVQSEANRLIDLFQAFQPYNKIKSIGDFEKLIKDPCGEFDEALQANVNFQESGGKKGNPDIIAKLFDIERDEYIGIIKGHLIDPASCHSCRKTPKIIKKGQPALSYLAYQKYQQYLTFHEGRFSVNENEVAKKAESFRVYAETPEAVELWEYWHNVLDTLNSLNKKNYCNDLHQLQVLLKERVMFSYATNQLALNEEALYHEITRLKN